MFDTSMIAILIVLAIFTLGITAWAAWENWPLANAPGALDLKASTPARGVAMAMVLGIRGRSVALWLAAAAACGWFWYTMAAHV